MNTAFRTALAVVLVAVLTTALLSCGGDSAASDQAANGDSAQDSRPQLASIGGVQDVWPFEFGFDADRAAVAHALGPAPVTESKNAADIDGAVIETWTYPEYSIVFFVDEDTEYLLMARITSAQTILPGGLRVGMAVDAARVLLGDPGFEERGQLVYFYYATTIALQAANGTIRSIELARALP